MCRRFYGASISSGSSKALHGILLINNGLNNRYPERRRRFRSVSTNIDGLRPASAVGGSSGLSGASVFRALSFRKLHAVARAVRYREVPVLADGRFLEEIGRGPVDELDEESVESAPTTWSDRTCGASATWCAAARWPMRR